MPVAGLKGVWMARMSAEAFAALRERGEVRRARSERKGAVGTRLMGGRKDFVARADALMAEASAGIKADLASDKGFAAEFLSTLKFGASKAVMDRTCIAIMARLYKLTGEERQLTIELVHRLGASSEEQLAAYVQSAKSVEGATLHDSAERCVAFLEAYMNVHPEARQAAVRRLGGYVPVEAR